MADNFFNINKGLSLASLGTTPTSPQDGDIWYQSGIGFQKRESGATSSLGSGGSGGASAYSSADDLLSLIYRAGFYEDFSQAIALNSAINTGAGYTASTNYVSQVQPANSYFALKYDASKTVTGTGINMTLSGSPTGFTVVIGDMLIVASEARRIVTVNSQTSYVLDSAFTVDPSAAVACVSQAVHTADINAYTGDGVATSAEITTSIDQVLVDYEDTSVVGGVIPAYGATANVGYSLSVDGALFSPVYTRPTLLTDTVNAVGFTTAGTNLYARFFAYKTSGSGTVNLLGFKLRFHPSTVLQNGNLLNQAYALLDGSATPINCTLSQVAGKTRVTLAWVYTNGVNTGNTNGQLDVALNGQKIPRFVNTSLTPDAYYKEISPTVIELDGDYSTFPYPIEVVKRIGVVDTSNTNASRITTLEQRPVGINYIATNPDAENGLSGWNLFADAAATSPVDGTGGSSTLTFSQLTSNALRGSYSFQLAKAASNCQGQGVSFDFTVDPADLAKVLQISFDYSATGVTFAGAGTNGDIQVWVYDKTNNVLIQPAAFTMDGSKSFTGRFQTASNSTQYRLILFVGSTNASAWTLVFDNVKCGPQTILLGTPVTDWQSYPLTIGGSTTAPTKGTIVRDNAKWRRVGDSVEIYYEFQQSAAGSAGSGTYLFPLPAGLSIDTSKVSVDTAHKQSVGSGMVSTAADGLTATSRVVDVFPYNSTNLALACWSGSDLFIVVGSATFGLGGGEIYSFNAVVPVVGWSSTVQMSNDTDTRVVAFSGTIASQAVTNSVTNVAATQTRDSHGAWNGSQFIVPVSGDYLVTGGIWSSGSTTAYIVYKNGVSTSRYLCGTDSGGRPQGGAALITGLVAGDILSIRCDSSVTLTAGGNLGIHRLSGPSAIAATESVNARYSSATGSVTSTAAAVSFTSKSFDSHNSYSGSTFTAPTSGKYQVNAALLIAGTFATNSTSSILIYKNGANYSNVAVVSAGAPANMNMTISDIVNCNAGDTIQIFVASNGTSVSLSTGDQTRNYLSLTKVGN
jgi:hypothetical protein